MAKTPQDSWVQMGSAIRTKGSALSKSAFKEIPQQAGAEEIPPAGRLSKAPFGLHMILIEVCGEPGCCSKMQYSKVMKSKKWRLYNLSLGRRRALKLKSAMVPCRRQKSSNGTPRLTQS